MELDKEEEYFERLEKKENLEEKLQTIRELRVAVVQCKEVGAACSLGGVSMLPLLVV